MQRDASYLLDIVEATKAALSYVAGKTRAEFLADAQCQDAVIRRLEIIGEAARRLSEEARATFPEIPWPAVIRMRNILTHEDDGVDLEIVRQTVQDDLQVMIDRIGPTVSDQEEAPDVDDVPGDGDEGGEMLSTVYSGAVYGVDLYSVEIEVNAEHGDP
jgi:uncharacterized protein with HEPN domain